VRDTGVRVCDADTDQGQASEREDEQHAEVLHLRISPCPGVTVTWRSVVGASEKSDP
jgi:hypothetical protein